MMWNYGSWSGGSWVLMAVMMIAFWSLVIGGIFWLVRRRRGLKAAGSSGPPGRQILDERFARGEFTEEEYQRRSDLLNAR